MTSIYRQRVVWQGFPGSPGYSNFYFLLAPADDTVRGFFDTIKNNFQSNVVWTIETAGDVLSAETGVMTGAWSGGVGGNISGSAQLRNCAGPAGGVVTWVAGGTRVNGKTPHGRTFLVPLSGEAYSDNGSIQGASVAAIQTAATGMITKGAGNLVVWTRPSPAHLTKRGVSVPARAGAASPITVARVPSRVSVLKSRRP